LGFAHSWIVALFRPPDLGGVTASPREPNIPCTILIVIVITILFFVFLAAVEFVWNLFESKKNLKDKGFIIRMTKSQFERKLDEFVNGSDETVLKLPRTLKNWRELKRRNKNWDDVNRKHIDDVRDADSIKLLLAPFRGLVLELVENNEGLVVSVNPEGDKEPITITRRERKHLVFQHAGYKNISVNQKAYSALLKWLNSLEKKQLKYE
jgi:hypothetical protein